ncbi:MAG: hypothetical protein HOF76_05190 [Candidatus Scalindua sp.]|nr:hypothetical protein [Candidatus Scalindua sp.]MBT5303771.1 hypothetical protein [Candidatus Scalindua sp.]
MNYKRKISTSYTEANSYIKGLYNPTISNIEADNAFLDILSNTSINTHVDRISFHCSSEIKEPEKRLFRALKDHGYSCKEDNLVEHGNFKRRGLYTHREKNIKIAVFYQHKDSCPPYIPDLRIIVDDPDIISIHWLDTICNSFGFTTTLSYVELSIDFSPFSDFLKDYLCRNLVLKYYRGTSRKEYESFYIGNKHKNSKSLIIYCKKIVGDILRLELRFNRYFLKSAGVELNCLEKVNSIDLSNIISFKHLNREKLINHLIWRHKSMLSMPYQDDRELIRQLRELSNISNIVTDQIHYMKKQTDINNSNRFFEDIPEANLAFYERLKNARYI